MTTTSLLFVATACNLVAWVRLWLESGQACDRIGHSRGPGGYGECRRCGEYAGMNRADFGIERLISRTPTTGSVGDIDRQSSDYWRSGTSEDTTPR
jgi:hypothetical protein